MERQKILSATYLDILFDNRNKQYGGYELRVHYKHRIRNAMLLTLGGCITFAVLSGIKRESNTIHADPIPTITTLSDLHQNIPKPKQIEIPKPATPPAARNTIAITPPKVVDDNVVIDKPLTNVNDLRTPGPTTTDPNSLQPDISTTSTTTSVTTTTTETKPALWVEQMPVFDGDLTKYISSNIRYPDIARENNITGMVTVRFVVNEDGSVSNATVLKGIGGDCDEEAIRIINSMPKWKPGKQNGHAVKVFFTLPIKFMLL